MSLWESVKYNYILKVCRLYYHWSTHGEARGLDRKWEEHLWACLVPAPYMYGAKVVDCNRWHLKLSASRSLSANLPHWR